MAKDSLTTQMMEPKGEEEKAETSINSAAIVHILENYSGHIKNGEIVKLTLGEIQRYLREFLDISIKSTDTIKANISTLQGLGSSRRGEFPLILCDGKYEEKEESFEEDFAYGDESLEDKKSEEETNKTDSHKVMRYWMPKTNLFDSGEYKILKAKIESDVSLNPTEKASLIRKIDSLSSSGYSKELGSLDNTPTSNIASLGNKNITKTIETIGKAIESNLKISFQLNVCDVNAQLYELEGVILFSPYRITNVKGNLYVIGLEDSVGQLTHYRIDKLSKVQIVKQTIDARDRNSKLQSYLEAHPFMSTSKKLVRATLKITKSDDPKDDILGEVFEYFGGRVKIREETALFSGDEYYLVDNLVASDEEVLMFALMYANRVELLSDNDKTELKPLRGVLRKTGVSLSEKYLKTPEDKYLAEVDKCSDTGIFAEYNRKFSVPGFDLSKRTEHHNLDLRYLSLRNNNITDIFFVNNYKKLAVFKNSGDNILDYSPLSNIETLQEIALEYIEIEDLNFIKSCKSLRKLTLRSVYVKDCSALYSNLSLDYLVLYHPCGIDIELVKANNPFTEVIVANEKDKVEAHINPIYPINHKYTVEYPLNMIREFFNVDQKDLFDISDEDMANIDAEVLSDRKIKEAADRAVDSLREDENRVLSCIMKDHLSIREIALKLGMRTGVCINLFETSRSHFNHLISGKTEFYEMTTEKYRSRIINRSLKDVNISNRGKAQRRARLKRVMYCSDDKLNFDEE